MSFRRPLIPLAIALIFAVFLGVLIKHSFVSSPPHAVPSPPKSERPSPITLATGTAVEDRAGPGHPSARTAVPADAVESDPLVAFAHWAESWNPAAGPESLERGVRLARERRAALYDLIADDPEAALEAEIDFPLRSRLPEPVIDLLEERVDGRGDLEWLAAAPRPGGPVPERPSWRVANIGGESWNAHVFGRREFQPTKLDLPLSGIAVDDRIAIRESPFRRLAPGEPIPENIAAPLPVALGDHATNADPVASAQGPLFLAGDEVLRLCCAGHAGLVESRLLAAEEGPGPWVGASGGTSTTASADPATAASSWTEGPKTVLVIRADFSDLVGTPDNGSGTTFTPAYLAGQINTEAQGFYDEVSYGKTSLSLDVGDVTGVLRMPLTAAAYATTNNTVQLRLDALAAAETAGFDTSSYDRIFVVFSDLGPGVIPGSQFTFGGLGQIGAPFMWMNGSFSGPLVNHELGHTYGLGHASLWDIPGGSSDPVDPAGTNEEYGDDFDRMGDSPGDSPLHPGHFNPWYLNRLNWLPDAAIQEITTSGTYRVYRFDHSGADLGSTLALKIGRDGTRDYWIGYRRKYAGHPTHGDMANGAYVMWGYRKAQNSHLLDLDTPGTNPRDASLNVGDTFDDASTGIEIATTAAGGSGAGEWLDITVTFASRIRLTNPVLDVDEQGGNAVVRLERSGSTAGAVTVTYQTVDGTATSPADFAATSSFVTWADGEGGEKSISIPIVGDGLAEGSETFTLELLSITGGVIVDDDIATINIVESGAADSGFSHGWFTNSGSIYDFAIQPDGKIAFAGRTANFDGLLVNGLARFESDGAVDTAFSAEGAGANLLPIHAIERQADGKLVVAGEFTTLRGVARPYIARLTPEGALDATFDPGAGPNGTIRDLAIQPDGKIVITGSFNQFDGVNRLAIARLNRDGSLDTGFLATPLSGVEPSSQGYVLALQPDGKILVGGFLYTSSYQAFFNGGFASGVWRLNADGTLDTSFDIGPGAHTAAAFNQLRNVYAIAVQPDGKVLVGGNFTGFRNQAVNRIVRLNANGTVDGTFRTNIGSAVSNNQDVEAILVQNDGRILLGGRFTSFDGNAINYVARLEANGSFDASFDANLTVADFGNGPFYNSVRHLGLQPDGRLLIAQDLYGQDQDVMARVFSGIADLPGTIELSTGSFIETEGHSVTVPVRRTGGSGGAIQVGYATYSGGTATETTDYTVTTGVLTWADGDSGDKTITIPLASDATIEPEETFTVQLGQPVGGALLGETGSALVTIADAAATSLDPTSSSITSAAQTYPINVTSTTSWSVSESLDWVSVSPGSGSGNATLTVTVEANATTATRMGDIDVGSATHQLTQLGVPAFLDVLPVSRGIDAAPQAYLFEISANIPWTIVEDLDWVTVSPESGSGDETIVVTVLENTAPEARNGVLQINGKTHTVSQGGTREVVALTPDAEADAPDTNPIPWDDALTGIYDGLLRDAADGHTLVGAIHRLVVSPPRPNSGPGGNVSATLYFDGRRSVIRGAFDADGRLLTELNQPDGSVIAVDLQLEGTGTANEERVIGTIAWNGLVAEADLPRAPFHPRFNPLPTPDDDPLNGVDTTYTALFPRDPSWNDQRPGGDGWATVSVNRGGIVRVRGALGDGTRFADVAFLSADRTFALFSEIHRPVAGLGRGRVGGRMVLRDQAGVSDFDGLVQWKKHPDPRERRYADGFDLETWALGSRFIAPAPGSPVLDSLAMEEFNAALALRGTELPGPGSLIDKVVTWRPNDAIVYYGPERINARANRRVGLVNGNYFDPATRTRLALRGIAFQKQQLATGHFLLATTSGAFGLQPGTGFPYPGSEDAGLLTRASLPGAPATDPATSPIDAFDAAAAGLYGGTVEVDASGDLQGGMLNFRVAPGGAFSGQLWIGRDRYVVRGNFDPANGTAQVPVPVGGGLAALLDLTLAQVDGADPGTGYRLIGSIEVDGIDYQLAAERRPGITTKNGAYTLVIRAPDGADPALEPAGDGYGVLTVTPTGITRGFVVLADGYRTALTGHLSSADEWSLYRPLYAGRRGYLSGKMTFRPSVGIGDVDGSVRWVRQSDAPPAFVYPGGFDTTRGVVGSVYTPPLPGERALAGLADDFFNAWLRLSGPDFSGDAGLGLFEIDRAITWAGNNRLLYYGPERVILRFNARNGFLSGRFLDRPNGVSASLGGVLLQEQDLVSGTAVTGGVSALLSIEGR